MVPLKCIHTLPMASGQGIITSCEREGYLLGNQLHKHHWHCCSSNMSRMLEAYVVIPVGSVAVCARSILNIKSFMQCCKTYRDARMPHISGKKK